MPRDSGDVPEDTAVDDSFTIKARLDAVEILLREVLGFTLGRAAIVERARRMADAHEREAVLSGDPGKRAHAAEVRAAVDRLTE